MDGFKYITTEGKAGVGDASNTTLKQAIFFTNDIFVRAIQEKLNVYVLCGPLNHGLLHHAFERAECPAFHRLLVGVLQEGRDVTIMVVGKTPADELKQFIGSVKELISQGDPAVGSLHLYHAEPKDDSLVSSVGHFSMAIGSSVGLGSRGRCFVGVEFPHEPFTANEIQNPETSSEMGVFFNTIGAIEQARIAANILVPLIEKARGDAGELKGDVESLSGNVAGESKAKSFAIAKRVNKLRTAIKKISVAATSFTSNRFHTNPAHMRGR